MKNTLLIISVLAVVTGIYLVTRVNNKPETPPKTDISGTSVSSSGRGERSSGGQSVPTPQETDIIRTFFNLINEGRPAEAVSMMNSADDTEKQAWAVQFNAIKSVKTVSLAPSLEDQWTATEHTYKVELEMSMDPASKDAPIPYYGYDAGKNIRWVTLVKDNGMWKIKGIATGP